MSKYLLALSLFLTALAAPAAETPEVIPATIALATGGELVRTSGPRAGATAVARVVATSGKRSVPEAAGDTAPVKNSSPDVGWEMVLAVAALMAAIALRRVRYGSR